MKHTLLIIIATVTLIGCKNKEELKATKADALATENTEEAINKENLTTAEAIAYASGLEHWDKVSELKFTFNVDRGGNIFSRSWQWNPKTDDVTMMTAEDTVAYNRSSLDSISTKADQAFINDKYWLHAPYNLVWDEGTTITEKKNEIAPMSKDTLNMVTITYNDSLGYTPGDAYDIYYDSEFMPREWVYRKGNAEEASMVTSWEDYKTFEGLKFAEMHKDPSGDFKLFFSDISVKTE
ncbi:hypothetical protein [Croceibacter atlanticus]|nr:hypothetical protein [Croceibacter atlanticus]MBW4969240.1 hypothetical protein [Croceibacter atlanticus]